MEALECRVLLAAAVASAVTPGDVDPSFGLGGRVLNATLPPAAGIAVDSAGRSLVVGTSNGDVFLARYTAAGVPDPTFGVSGNGFILSDFGGEEQAGGVAIQPDGKIVIVASETIVPGDTELLVARYLPSGALDPTFGGGGGAALSDGGLRGFGLASEPRAVVISADGRIIVGGDVRNELTGATTALVAQLTGAGAFDATFGNGHGFSIFGGGASHVNDVAVEHEGRVIAVGDGFPASGTASSTSAVSSSSSFLVTLLTSAGAVDTTFAPGRLPAGMFGTFNGVAIQPTGKIIAAGGTRTADGAQAQAIVARFNTDGSLDTTFGQGHGGGFTAGVFDPGTSTAVFSDVKIQPGGRIVAGGSAFRASEGRDLMFVEGFTGDGIVDTTFGVNGASLPAFPNSDTISRIALDGGNNVLAAGRYGPESVGGGLALTRLFGGDSTTTTTTTTTATALVTSHKHRKPRARHGVLTGA